MKRRSTYLGFGLAAVLALVAVAFFLADQIQTTSAAGGGTEMSLNADGCAADCTFANDEKFTLVVEIVQGPADPYVGAQSFIDFGPDIVYDGDLAAAADEVVWPDCSEAVALRSVFPEFVAHGCLSGLIPPLPTSTYVGNFLEISLTCSSSSSTTEIRLVPSGDPDAPTSGAAFVLEDLVTQVVPKVSDLSVTCGAGPPADTATPAGPTDTPGPTNTPAPATDTPVSPTATPVPDQICGDVDRDGQVSSLDAMWVLWFDAGLVNALLPLKDNDQDGLTDLIGDINGDRLQNSIDAALILQIAADLYDCA